MTFTAANVIAGSLSGSDLTVNGNLMISNPVAIPGLIAVTGDATLNGNLTSTAGAMNLGGNVSGTGALAAAGAIDISGALTLSGPTSAGTNLTVGGPVRISSGITLTAGNVMLVHAVSLTGDEQAASLESDGPAVIVGRVTVASNATFNSSLGMVGNLTVGGSFVVNGNASLTGAIAALDISVPAGISLPGNLSLTAQRPRRNIAGQYRRIQNLTLTTNDPTSKIIVGAIGSPDPSRMGDVTIRSANVTQLEGDIYAANVNFEDNLPGTRLDVPTVATITHDGSLVIDTHGTFSMELNQKLTVHDSVNHIGDLTIRSDGSQITLGDLSALGKITVDAQAVTNHIVLLWRQPQTELLSTGLPDTDPDQGSDIVAGFNGTGAISFRGLVQVVGGDTLHRVEFASVSASSDIANQPGKLDYMVGSNIAVIPINIPSGSVVKESDLVFGTTVLDLSARGVSGNSPTSSQGTVIPRDVQTLQPERNQAISGALRDALRELGIYARDLRTDEVIEYLIGRALYDDVPYKLDPGPTDNTVAANRLPYSPVLPTVDAYRRLFFKQDVDDKGIPIFVNGKPKMVSQDNVILVAFGQAWQLYRKDKGDEGTPAGFRGYLEAHAADEDKKYVTALDYLNQLRDLLTQIKSLGLTSNEFEVSRTVILGRVRPPTIREEDFSQAVDGPTTITGNKTAAK